MLINNRQTIQAVRLALSAARMHTYEQAVGIQDNNDMAALTLYSWNSEVSSAFLPPLHICEVVIRNAVSNALEAIFSFAWI